MEQGAGHADDMLSEFRSKLEEVRRFSDKILKNKIAWSSLELSSIQAHISN